MIENDVVCLRKSEKHPEKYEEGIINGNCGNILFQNEKYCKET